MGDTARRGDELKEFFDSRDILERKVATVSKQGKPPRVWTQRARLSATTAFQPVLRHPIAQVAKWITESRATIAFTGAGISTSAGIPDFRSGMDTCLKTGPGVWELDAHKAARPAEAETIATLQAIPTKTHMTLCALEKAGNLQHLVSQNCDGLHRRSAFPPEKLSELHGNSNLETCGGRATKKGGPVMKGCGAQFLRDYDATADYRYTVFDHRTGRKCPKCGCALHDTIINFSENLPEKDLTASFEWAERADVCLAMGSSLTVTPAADVPYNVTKKSKGRGGKAGRLVIVNLQRTELHDHAAMVIHAKCDDFSALLARALGLEVPRFSLHRFIRVRLSYADRSTGSIPIKISGEDSDGTPYELLRKLTAMDESGTVTKRVSGDAGGAYGRVDRGAKAAFKVDFFGHYSELPLHIKIDAAKLPKGGDSDDASSAAHAAPAKSSSGALGGTVSAVIRCSYDPLLGEWTGASAAGGLKSMPSWLSVASETRGRAPSAAGAAASGGAASSVKPVVVGK